VIRSRVAFSCPEESISSPMLCCTDRRRCRSSIELANEGYSILCQVPPGRVLLKEKHKLGSFYHLSIYDEPTVPMCSLPGFFLPRFLAFFLIPLPSDPVISLFLRCFSQEVEILLEFFAIPHLPFFPPRQQIEPSSVWF